VRNRGPAPPFGESGGPWFARVGPEKLNRLRPDRFSGPLCVFEAGRGFGGLLTEC